MSATQTRLGAASPALRSACPECRSPAGVSCMSEDEDEDGDPMLTPIPPSKRHPKPWERFDECYSERTHWRRKIQDMTDLPSDIGLHLLTPECWLLYSGPRFLGRIERGIGMMDWGAFGPGGAFIEKAPTSGIPKLVTHLIGRAA